jgi:hypothetical protein
VTNTTWCNACLEEAEAKTIRPNEVQPARAKGLCTKHYRRQKRNGTTEAMRAANLGETVELTVRIPVAAMKMLRRDAKREKCSVADLVRRAVGAAVVCQ